MVENGLLTFKVDRKNTINYRSGDLAVKNHTHYFNEVSAESWTKSNFKQLTFW
jgi:hypothetical protein